MRVRHRPELRRRRVIVRDRVERRDDRRGDAGAAEDLETGVAAIRVVHPDTGGRIRDGGDVGHRAPCAPGIGLPRGLGLIGAAAASGAAPRGLGEGAAAVPYEGRAPDRDDVRRHGGIVHSVAGVTRSRGDGHTGMVEIRVVDERLEADLGDPVAVAHRVRTQRDSPVHARAQVTQAGAVGLDQQDVALRADRADHVEIERDLLRPSVVGCRIARPAVLVDLAEAPVRGCARCEPEARAVHGKVALGVRVVHCIHDRHGLARACRQRRRVVRSLQIGRPVGPAVWDQRGRRCRGPAPAERRLAAASVRTWARQCATPVGTRSEQALTSTSPFRP